VTSQVLSGQKPVWLLSSEISITVPMKRLLLALSIVTVFSSAGFAQKFIGSPAQDLFDQAAFFLETQYFGPSQVNMLSLIAKYQLEVDKVCESAQLQCNYETVEPLVATMMDELQDLHAFYMSPAVVKSENQQSTGTVTSPSPRMGFSHAAFAEYQKQIIPVGGFSPALLELAAKGELKFQSFDRMILNVVSGSPAEKAGFRYGDRWIGYNNTLFSSFTSVTDYAAFLSALTPKIQAREKIVFNFLRGSSKSPVNIEATADIINAAPFPTMFIDENNVAMIQITDFLVLGVAQQMHNLVRTAIEKNVKAIMLNLRGSRGGYASESLMSLGALLENPEPIRFVPRYNPDKNTNEEVWFKDSGTYVLRKLSGAELGRSSVQNPVLYKGALGLLVDGGCASACEYLVSRVQRAKRAPIAGLTTTGIGDTNTFRFALANGGAASMPTVRAFWSDGKPLPSKIEPDFRTPDVEYTLFSTGRDLGVDKVLETLGIKLSGVANVPMVQVLPTWGAYQARLFSKTMNF
jgi:carboxyl-terminal processing protease